MTIIDLTQRVLPNNRADLRREIVNIFLEEQAGTGKGDLTSRYRYIVKKVGNNEIYLNRPAQFNNGFDFTLNVSGINFNPNGRATTRPTHQNIYDDLVLKKQKNPILYSQLRKEIDNIYNCQNVNNYIFNFGVGMNSEILLECIKWLFIEQDVTYWNYSGRAMFYDSISKV